MSFFKKLFGGGEARETGPRVIGEDTYKGYQLRAIERKEGGEFQVCGQIEKQVDGAVRTHNFVRADRVPSADIAANSSLNKARQIVDELGDAVFDQPSMTL